MENINIDTWKRKQHFEFFRNVTYPIYKIGINLDVTELYKFVKENNLSFYYTMIYCATKTMNQQEDFLYKIRDNGIIKHDYLNPSFTDLAKGSDLFKIVTAEMKDNLYDFVKSASAKSKNQKDYFIYQFEGRDDLIYFSCLPWVSFTEISTEINIDKNDSIPRIVWGKYFESNNKLLMPFSISVNHALIDGYQVCKYINELQYQLNNLRDIK